MGYVAATPLRRDYPAIAARARAEGGAVFWGDETGPRSDDVRGRSYAPGAGRPRCGSATSEPGSA